MRVRCHNKDGEEQTGVGQAPGGARERNHGEGPDCLAFLHTRGRAAPPEPHRHASKSLSER